MKSSMKSNWVNSSPVLIYALIMIGIALAIFCMWLSASFHQPLSTLFTQFKDGLYAPHYNQILTGSIGRRNVLQIFYVFVALAILLTVLCHPLMRRWKLLKKPINLSQAISIVGITGLLLLAGIQQIKRAEHLILEMRRFSGKSVAEKNSLLFGQGYQFAQTCQKHLDTFCRAALLTDSDLTRDPYMFNYSLLSYHLYPKVSLRFKNRYPEDCLIFFYKKNPLEMVPGDYKILVATANHNYILAIKDKTKK